jgi:PEP-CTERM motif
MWVIDTQAPAYVMASKAFGGKLVSFSRTQGKRRQAGSSSMKQLITISILLLAGPPLASAQTFDVTSGSMVHFLNQDYPYTIAGLGFSSSGDITPIGQGPLDFPVGPGSFSFVIDGNTSEFDLSVASLTVHGVPWSYPAEDLVDAGAFSAFETTAVFGAHPGVYHSPFTFLSGYIGGPASLVSPDGCLPTCMLLHFFGSGTVTWDLVPDPNFPGQFDIKQATFTFKAPEPSTASLLLIALGALGFQAWARMRREQRV